MQMCALRSRVSLMRALVHTRQSSSAPETSTAPPPAPPPTLDDLDLDKLVDDLSSAGPSSSFEGLSFATMLRRSKFMQLGDFSGRLVVGKVERRVMDDLYIDVGLKFPAVCKATGDNMHRYIRGSRVLVRLLDPELSARFLGSKKDLTLLEADATLIRLLYTPGGKRPQQEQNAKKGREVKQESKESRAE